MSLFLPKKATPFDEEAILRRSGHGFSKKRADPRTKRIFLAGENTPADGSACLIGFNVITETEMFMDHLLSLKKRGALAIISLHNSAIKLALALQEEPILLNLEWSFEKKCRQDE